MPTFSNTPRPAYVYEAATDQWIPVGFGPHTHAVTDVTNAFNTTTVTTKGDLVVAAGSNNITRLAAGNSGEQLVADSSTSTGLRYTSNFASGKNKVINGAFDVWQRGTSFTATGYTADRFRAVIQNSTTISRQTFTPGTAPVAGYEGQYYLRLARTTSTTGDFLTQKIEDVRTFAGQTVTVSFWAKANASVALTSLYLEQDFGSGGSGAVSTSFNAPTITTSWVRYSYSVAVPSISGKTVGTSSFLDLIWAFGSGMGNCTVEIWGVQLEAGSVATAFQTATGTLQGELAACQRYFWQVASGSALMLGSSFYFTSTQAEAFIQYPVTMRTTPVLIATSGANYYRTLYNAGLDAFDSLTINAANNQNTRVYNNTEVSGAAGSAGVFFTNNASSSVAFSAEL
jgi:hypothetical protein